MAEKIILPMHTEEGPIVIGRPHEHEGITFVISPGGWLKPEIYVPFAEALLERGYPSVLARPAAADTSARFRDDTRGLAEITRGLERFFLLGHSRGNELITRLHNYVDAERIVGALCVSWGGPHGWAWRRRFPFEPEPSRYTKEFHKGVTPISKKLSRYNPEVAPKVFWNTLRDPDLLALAAENLTEQRIVHPNEKPASAPPPEIMVVSVLGFLEKALIFRRALRANQQYIGNVILKPWDHTPFLSSIEGMADLAVDTANQAWRARYST